jgi:3-oxoacyl-[acyl-carrier protein] reductase
MSRLTGKTVIVTGAAHGIGRAYAERLAEDGANVALLDIDGPRNNEVAAGIGARGGSAIAIDTDMRVWAQVESAVGQTVERFGGLTGIVNNCGMLNVVPISRVTIENIPDEEWDEAFRVNTKSAWYGAKAALPHLKANGGGSIVNIASSTILIGPPTRGHYVASKAALIGLTRVMAREWGEHWIRVNAVCPGSILSEEEPDEEILAMRRRPVAQRMLKRVELPSDMVGTIAFLQSDDSAFMTGQVLLVDGGQSFLGV